MTSLIPRLRRGGPVRPIWPSRTDLWPRTTHWLTHQLKRPIQRLTTPSPSPRNSRQSRPEQTLILLQIMRRIPASSWAPRQPPITQPTQPPSKATAPTKLNLLLSLQASAHLAPTTHSTEVQQPNNRPNRKVAARRLPKFSR